MGRQLSPGHWLQFIQREIHFQYIHPRLAEEAQLAAAGVLANDLANLILAQTPLAGEARYLEFRCRRRDVWIQS